MTDETQEVETEKTGGVVSADYRNKYGKDKHCGDDVATLLKSFTTDDKGKPIEGKLASVASANGIDLEKYSHLNYGMQRMTIGNKLRGLLRNGKKVKIGKETIDPPDRESQAA
jgi:hypothetical protein